MKRILIIEDEEMISDMYKDKFEFEKFDVSTALDGEEGLEKALQEKPDIILLDILLPKKEGTEVLEEIRKSGKWGEEVPIIMLTNLDSNDGILDSISEYSPSYYLIKSNTDLDKLVAKVNNLL